MKNENGIELNPKEYEKGIEALRNEAIRAFKENFGEKFGVLAEKYINTLIKNFEEMASIQKEMHEHFNEIVLGGEIKESLEKESNLQVREYKISLNLEVNCDDIMNITRNFVYAAKMLKDERLNKAISWDYAMRMREKLKRLLEESKGNHHIEVIMPDDERDMGDVLDMILAKTKGPGTTN